MKATTNDNLELFNHTLINESERFEKLEIKAHEKGIDKINLSKEMEATINKLSEIKVAIESGTLTVEVGGSKMKAVK